MSLDEQCIDTIHELNGILRRREWLNQGTARFRYLSIGFQIGVLLVHMSWPESREWIDWFATVYLPGYFPAVVLSGVLDYYGVGRYLAMRQSSVDLHYALVYRAPHPDELALLVQKREHDLEWLTQARTSMVDRWLQWWDT